jgi:hypothetical protein
MLILEAQKLVLVKSPTVYTSERYLGGILSSKGGLWLSDNQLLRNEAQLLDGLEVTLKTCPIRNPRFPECLQSFL